VHAVAFEAAHWSVALVPFAIVVGVALSVTIGAGDLIATLADCVAVPTALLQVNVYVAFAVKGPVD
jgi:hypothetical protein